MPIGFFFNRFLKIDMYICICKKIPKIKIFNFLPTVFFTSLIVLLTGSKQVFLPHSNPDVYCTLAPLVMINHNPQLDVACIARICIRSVLRSEVLSDINEIRTSVPGIHAACGYENIGYSNRP